MTDISISPTRDRDVPALQDIVRLTGLFPPELLPEMVADGLAAGHVWLTAQHANRHVGFCYARPEPMTDGTWNMLALAVSPDRQATGVGRGLVAQLERDLAALGHRLLLVDTSGDDAYEGARAFYGAVGYQQVSSIADYWAEGDAKITFAKSLK